MTDQPYETVRHWAPPFSARDEIIKQKYISGLTAQQIADEYGVTRERVCQVLRRDNVIGTAKERQRLARLQLKEQEAEIRAQAKAEIDRKIAEGIELVRGGKSISVAAAEVGLHIGGKATLGAAVRTAGIPLTHGRHRSFDERRRKVAALLAEGKTNAEIMKALRDEGDPIYAAWLYNHFPESRRGHFPGATVPAAPKELSPRGYPLVRAMARPPFNPDAKWTDEKVVLLRRQWLAGSTAQQIADMLGGEFTRLAILGKVNRLREAGELFKAE